MKSVAVAVVLFGIAAHAADRVVPSTVTPLHFPTVTGATFGYGWTNFNVDCAAPKPTAPERLLSTERIVINDQIYLTRNGVTVDGEQMDHDDLALRAMTAWLRSSYPGIECRDENHNASCAYDNIFVGGKGYAGVRLLINDRKYLEMETGVRWLKPDDHNVRLILYWEFWHWLRVARMGDKRFARKLAARDYLPHSSPGEEQCWP